MLTFLHSGVRKLARQECQPYLASRSRDKATEQALALWQIGASIRRHQLPRLASVAGEIKGGALTNRRPFRAPHHSASIPALVGGGLHARPCEISLAHHGVLFLDELPEFQPQVLDAMRPPLETGEVAIVRANRRAHPPGALHAGRGDESVPLRARERPRLRLPPRAERALRSGYQARISGPLIDRIDLHIEVPAVTAADLLLPPPAEGSREVAERIALARERQAVRYAAIGLPHLRTNAAVSGSVL